MINVELEKKWELLAKKVYDYAIDLLGEPETEEDKEMYEEFLKLTYNTSTKKWICSGYLDCNVDLYVESETMTNTLEMAFEQLEKDLEIQQEKINKGELHRNY